VFYWLAALKVARPVAGPNIQGSDFCLEPSYLSSCID
jgi:hypothetical protein